MIKVAIHAKKLNPEHLPYVLELLDKLHQNNIQIYLTRHVYEIAKTYIKHQLFTFENNSNINKLEVSYFITLGGDGSFLEAVTYVKDANIPIIGINLGRLGFLSYIQREEIEALIKCLLDKNYKISERTLIEIVQPQLFGSNNFALNECAIQKKDTSAMMTIHTYIDDEYLNAYWADGLIISTPTGSTAYSLSCGGPILIPNSNNFVITPIAPHNLNVRPFVVPDYTTIQLKVENREKEFLISMDSRFITTNTAETIIIKKANFTIKLLQPMFNNYFQTLRNKLMWGIDKRN